MRLPWVDHLRTFVIILVVNLHACVTYSHVGDWYTMSPHEPTLSQKIPFILWQGTLQSFFMGLLFFVSGYFANGSLARKGAGAFVRERLFRLGLPALFYMWVIHPFIVRGLNPWHADFGPVSTYYLNYLRTWKWLGSSGPLWFVIALLIFCLGLVVWRKLVPERHTHATTPSPRNAGEVTPGRTEHSSPVARHPSLPSIALFVLIVGTATFLVRLSQPIGKNVFNLQLCFFAQYIAFFAAGVNASRCGWLKALAASPLASRAGWTILLAGPLSLLAIMAVFGTKQGIAPYMGGWNVRAFAAAMWEQFSGVGWSLGLLAVFSRKLNFERPWLRWLADRSFGVYLFHAPILVALTMLFRALPQNMYLLVALLTVTGWIASFIVADVAKRIPGLRAIA